MPSKPLRIGVLTGGGDCPGINAALRAVTKSLTVKHNAEVLGFLDGFRGLVERNVEAGPMSRRRSWKPTAISASMRS